MAVCQNLVPLVNIKIAGKWMFIPLKRVCLGIDPYPYNPPSLFEANQGGRRWKVNTPNPANKALWRGSLTH